MAGSLAYSGRFLGVNLYVKDNTDIRVATRSRSREFDGFRGCFAAIPALSLVENHRVRAGVFFSVSVHVIIEEKYNTASSTLSTSLTNDWAQLRPLIMVVCSTIIIIGLPSP
jgi:hypothetical protein